MKTRNQIETTSGITSPRRITARTAVSLLVVLGAAGSLFAAIASGHSAKEIRGATPYVEIENEPPPMLIVDPPLTNLLAQGIVWIQWRVENVRILPVFGKGALNVSPRVGHFHICVDDLPWLWADASNLNTIDLAGMPPGPHKVRIDLADANHQVFPGQSKTVTFTVTGTGPHTH
ncbi:MAG TPA: DUF6130 family protein [Verrucomicrobiae bacterium]|nr:DUF6130 family protein [Verrucomicrobiae bacterium]